MSTQYIVNYYATVSMGDGEYYTENEHCSLIFSSLEEARETFLKKVKEPEF